MPKLSELLNEHTVSLTSEPVPLEDNDLKNADRQNTRRFHVTATGTDRSFDFYFYGPKTNVVVPSSHRYHPRYLVNIPVTQTVDTGQVMPLEWWQEYGYPVAPQLAEIAGYLADLSFTFQDISSFEDFCALKHLDTDSRRAYAYYQELAGVVDRLKVFLGDLYPIFLTADIDL